MLRERRRLQMPDPILPMLPFQRLVKEIAQSYKPHVQFESSALYALQDISEAYLIDLFSGRLSISPSMLRFMYPLLIDYRNERGTPSRATGYGYFEGSQPRSQCLRGDGIAHRWGGSSQGGELAVEKEVDIMLCRGYSDQLVRSSIGLGIYSIRM